VAEVVVVGAGMGGLAVAARLATLGHRVTVCERSEDIGGKLGWFTRDGFSFDTGPSLLTLPAVYRDLFLKTGGPLEAEVDLVPVDPVCHYRFADGVELDLPNASRGAVTAALDTAFGAGAGADWAGLMDRAGRIWDATRGPFLESALDGVRGLLRESRKISDLRTVAPWRSLRSLGRQQLRDPHLRMLLDRYATYTGSDPRRAPAALASVPYVEQTFGAWYVRGGLRQLGLALYSRVLERGAVVHTSAGVASIQTAGGKVSGVHLEDGSQLPADIVVSDVDARALYADLVAPQANRRALPRLDRVTPSLSGFVLLLALRGRSTRPAHHTVLFPADYDDEFDSVFGSGRHRGRPRAAPDPTVYIAAPDDRALRPDDDHEAWFVLVNAPRHVPDEPAAGVDWDARGASDGYADRILEVMAARGVDVRDRLLWREIRTPADLERATGSVGGSIYGSSSNGARAAFLRPANRSPVPGLFLVGGSAHPGGGLPLVGLSAAIVAGLVGRA
jgi:phytoene desaturase